MWPATVMAVGAVPGKVSRLLHAACRRLWQLILEPIAPCQLAKQVVVERWIDTDLMALGVSRPWQYPAVLCAPNTVSSTSNLSSLV